MKLEDIGWEYRGAVLGDRRRSERLERIAAGAGTQSRSELPRVNIHDAGAASGFRLHASLAVTPTRTPLGSADALLAPMTVTERRLRRAPSRRSLLTSYFTA